MHFDRSVVINLDRRPDRLAEFRQRFPVADWSLAVPERVSAIDGLLVPKPAWFPYSAGAWGCTRSHLRVYEEAMNNGHDLFVFEDDAVFAADFGEQLHEFLAAVPSDWDMIYLGGAHHLPVSHPPEPVNERVLLARGVGCCTAYGIRHEFLTQAWPLLLAARPHVIDHLWCQLQLQNAWKIYCPTTWICGQDAGRSDVDGLEYKQPRYWNQTVNFFQAKSPWEEMVRREALAAIKRSGGLALVAEVGSQRAKRLLADYIAGGNMLLADTSREMLHEVVDLLLVENRDQLRERWLNMAHGGVAVIDGPQPELVHRQLTETEHEAPHLAIA